MPIPANTAPTDKTCSSKPAAGVSLPVLPDPKKTIRKSRMGRWRALVLILVNLAIIGHITLWVVTGMRATLSPVEPSESMYTLERGLINAGFIFFALAILSTLILGRFFCGWACHVVALQDLCGWFMKKLGVRPKPFRSRLLIIAPLLLALYMFVWPTLKREVIRPWALHAGTWQAIGPYIGEAPPPVFRSRESVSSFFRPELMKKDFWKTFPAWYTAIPFLGICGFAAVYFLGSKGFCTYGCPYGGFFGPADKLAVGRIRVTDACEHCGHCTSVCTSNVRVHEEVRDYGMVVDPGCMKCMDCISVCPNDALYFGLGMPSLLAKPRTERADRKARFKSRIYDLSLAEEIMAGVVFLALVLGFRGMFNEVPLLMAMGIAAIGAFLAWKLVSLIRLPNVRIQSLQLKLKGSVKPAGFLFGALAILMLCAGAWGAVVNFSRWHGGVLDSKLLVPAEKVFAPAYNPAPADKALADRAIASLTRSGPRREGGIGWSFQSPDFYIRLAWLSAAAGRLEEAESNIRKGIAFAAEFPEGPGDDLLTGLSTVMSLRGQSADQITRAYRDLLAAAKDKPGVAALILMSARIDLAFGNTQAALDQADLAATKTEQPRILVGAAQLLGEQGRLPRAVEIATHAVELQPRDSGLRSFLGAVLAASGEGEKALAQIDQAARLSPKDPRLLRQKAELLRGLGRPAEAAAADERATLLESATPPAH